LRLQRERDAALEDRRQLEAEIQALRASHRSVSLSLHKILHTEVVPKLLVCIRSIEIRHLAVVSKIPVKLYVW